MSGKEIIKRVREDMARRLYEIASDERDSFVGDYKLDIRKARKWGKLPSEAKAYWYMRAGQLLTHPNIAIIDPDAEAATYISYLLGLEGGTELFKNYPDNFNRIMRAVSDKLKEAGWRKVAK